MGIFPVLNVLHYTWEPYNLRAPETMGLRKIAEEAAILDSKIILVNLSETWTTTDNKYRVLKTCPESSVLSKNYNRNILDFLQYCLR